MEIVRSSYNAIPQLLRGSVTFAAGTTGAIAQHTVFTITGMVAFNFFARCTDPLTSGGAATISHGNVVNVADLGAATTATTIDADDSLTHGSSAWIEAANFGQENLGTWMTSTGTDIIADILTATITGGTLEYYLFWQAISVGATVALGAELTQI